MRDAKGQSTTAGSGASACTPCTGGLEEMAAMHGGSSPLYPQRSNVRPPTPHSSGDPRQHPLFSASLLSTCSPASISHPSNQSAVARRAPAKLPAAPGATNVGLARGRHACPWATCKYDLSHCLSLCLSALDTRAGSSGWRLAWCQHRANGINSFFLLCNHCAAHVGNFWEICQGLCVSR